MECPDCDGHEFTESEELEEFLYGVAPDQVKLSAKVPVITCAGCGFQWTDHRGEQARGAAVTKHLARG